MSKILLVRTTNPDNSITVIAPLGLLYIAAAIRKRYGNDLCSVRIIDFMLDVTSRKRFAEIIFDFAPDVIGFSSLHCEYELFKDLSTLARDIAPETTLIAGGPLASDYHNEILEDKFVDIAIIGEGEETIIELLEALGDKENLSNIRGIAYLEENKAVRTPSRETIQNLDEIPFPAWDLVDLKNYSKMPNMNGVLWNKYYAPIMTSRGCIYHCIYCHNFFGKRVRTRSIKNVLDEMEILFKYYDITEFHIIDDFFNYDLDRVKELCKGITERRLKIKLAFPNGLKADNMDSDTLLWLKMAGTYKINYAIETINQRLQKMIRKNLNLNRAKRVIEMTSNSGIVTLGFFMLGFPTETIEEMKETISFAVNSRLDTAKFSKVIIHKNTALSRLTGNKFLGDIQDNSYYSHGANFSDLPLGLFNDVVFNAYREFYFRLDRIARIFNKYNKKLDVLKRLFKLYTIILSRKHEVQF